MSLQETFNDVPNALKKIMIIRKVFTTLLSNSDKVHLIHHYNFCLCIVNIKFTNLNITVSSLWSYNKMYIFWYRLIEIRNRNLKTNFCKHRLIEDICQESPFPTLEESYNRYETLILYVQLWVIVGLTHV